MRQAYSILWLMWCLFQGYLKEILGEIAEYNRNPPHRFTWELKAEYRHYGNTS